jgi:hypothetical protein
MPDKKKVFGGYFRSILILIHPVGSRAGGHVPELLEAPRFRQALFWFDD